MKLISFDKKSINVNVWDKVENPIGTVQIVHGMAEHSGKYETFAKELNDMGYVVYADDHRGHGLTDEKTLGYADGDMFGDTLKDEIFIAELLREKYPNVKHILFSHSYGSFIAQKFISVRPELIDGVVLYGSSYKKDLEVYSGLAVAEIGKIFKGKNAPSKLIERLSFGAYSQKFKDRLWLSVDHDYNKSYYSDKFCAFTCSNNFYASFFKGLISLYTKKYASGLDKSLPMLLISGASDPVGNMGKGMKKLYNYYKAQGVENIKLYLIDGSRHVCLGEKINREEFIKEVVNFMSNVSSDAK